MMLLCIIVVGCKNQSLQEQTVPISQGENRIQPTASPEPTMPVPTATMEPTISVSLDGEGIYWPPRCVGGMDFVSSGGFHWSPNGQQMLLLQNDTYLAQLNQEREEFTLQKIVKTWRGYSGEWSPDGWKFAFIGQPEQLFPQKRQIMVYDVSNDQVMQLVEISADPKFLKWSPDGHKIFYYETSNFSKNFRVINLHDNSLSDLAVPEIWLNANYFRVFDISWSPSGEWLGIVALAGNTEQDTEFGLFLLHSVSAEIVHLFPESFCIDYFIDWSPDGQKLAFSALVENSWDLYVADIVSGQIVQITDSLDNEFQPTWSPNGQHLAFISVNSQDVDQYFYSQNIFQVDADGSNRKLIVAMNDDECCLSQPTWVPNQNAISFFVETIEGCDYHWQVECQTHIDVINLDDSTRMRLITLPKE